MKKAHRVKVNGQIWKYFEHGEDIEYHSDRISGFRCGPSWVSPQANQVTFYAPDDRQFFLEQTTGTPTLSLADAKKYIRQKLL